jgi:hypothetical protein
LVPPAVGAEGFDFWIDAVIGRGREATFSGLLMDSELDAVVGRGRGATFSGLLTDSELLLARLMISDSGGNMNTRCFRIFFLFFFCLPSLSDPLSSAFRFGCVPR